jgi:hypothetical protein
MNYIGAGNQLPIKAEAILAELGELQCTEIEDSIMLELVEDIWPAGAAPATINRHLHTPVLAVLHMALKEHAPELTRPKGHNAVLPVIIPPENWYRALAPQLNPNQFAFVMMMAMHGRRTREMLGRSPRDLDMATGISTSARPRRACGSLRFTPARSGCCWPCRDGKTGSGRSMPARRAPTVSAATSRRPASALGSNGTRRTRSAGTRRLPGCCAPATRSRTSLTRTA